MGVQGLWKLLESAGKPIPVENLENKVLSIGILFLKQYFNLLNLNVFFFLRISTYVI